MNLENARKFNGKSKIIRLIVEETDERIDFSDFIDEVANFKEEMRPVNKRPCNLEKQECL
jgi:hypothetical protein